jgi:putative transposase
MGIESCAPKAQTSKPAPEHPVYPYLLRGLKIAEPNQVWASDITYIPLAQSFAYLVVIMDWHSRRVLSSRLSNTIDPPVCVEALEEALEHFEQPEIFDTAHEVGIGIAIQQLLVQNDRGFTVKAR